VRSHWSIRTHLITLVMAIAIPLGALGGYWIYSEFRLSAAQAEGTTISLAEVTVSTVSQFLEDARSTLLDLSLHPDVVSLDPGRCTALLEELNAFFPQYTNLFVTDLDAVLVCSGLQADGESPDPPVESEWFQGVLATDAFTVGKPHLGLLSGLWNVVLAHPVRGPDGALIGVAGVAVDLMRFQELLARPVLPRGTVITIDDLDGVVVARSADAEDWLGRPIPPSGVAPQVLAQPAGVTRAVGVDGVERVWGFAATPDAPWRVWVGIPTHAIYGPIREAAIQKAMVAVVLVCFVGILAILLWRRLANSLVTLMREARSAADGGGPALSLQGPREVLEVAAEFNRTLEARSRAEEGQRRSLERYRSVMKNAVFGIFVATPEGRFLEVNPALVAMLGYDSEEELREVSLLELFRDPEDRDRFLAAGEREGTTDSGEAEWLRRDGTAIRVRLNENVIRLADGSMAREVLAEDVTERRILEEQIRQAQKMEAVGRLAGGVAHDFNNLLTVITGSAHLLLADLGSDDPRREGVEEVLDAATRGATLTGQLLAFSRKQVLRPTVLDLNRVVQEMEAFLGRLLGDAVELRTQLEPELWPVRADPGQVQQVLMNLVLNARDAIENSGPVEIRTRNVILGEEEARTVVDLGPGAYACLSVRDEGTGIPEEIHGRVFEPFFTTKPEGQGTGLGLATVYGIAVQSGGHVALESVPGRGSVFTVFLPVADGPLG
jgi:PAS domain S-box-containing protein